jgi:hypothetical protein
MHSTFKKHGFAYVMGAFFGVSLLLHFIFGYYSHQTEEQVFSYTILRDMFENWQSEMLQLLLQVVLLAYLWYVGSSQSMEGDARLEAKIDFIMKEELERKFPKK